MNSLIKVTASLILTLFSVQVIIIPTYKFLKLKCTLCTETEKEKEKEEIQKDIKYTELTCLYAFTHFKTNNLKYYFKKSMYSSPYLVLSSHPPTTSSIG